MSLDTIRIIEFRPIWLTVAGNGPFPENPYSIDFTDAKGAPCNAFLFMSDNGMGKTTLLQIMANMMRVWGEQDPKSWGMECLDSGQLRAQWDLRLRIYWQGKEKVVILSLLAGNFGDDLALLKPWGTAELFAAEADSWHVAGHRRRARGMLTEVGRNDPLCADLTDTLREWNQAITERSSGGFSGIEFDLPTVLYFSAYRDIPPIASHERAVSRPAHWGYRTAHIFDPHANRWADSLDNLLVWLKWLDQNLPEHEQGRFDRARDFINRHVFDETPDKFLEGISVEKLEANVRSGDSYHRLDQLSSGEKNLVHLFLRIGAHLTRHTLILIDEPEVHLHPRWQYRLIKQLKALAKTDPGITVVAATHSIDMLKAFSFEVPEEGLHKGGEIIEKSNRQGVSNGVVQGP